jgi:hypothetical protein
MNGWMDGNGGVGVDGCGSGARLSISGKKALVSLVVSVSVAGCWKRPYSRAAAPVQGFDVCLLRCRCPVVHCPVPTERTSMHDVSILFCPPPCGEVV